ARLLGRVGVRTRGRGGGRGGGVPRGGGGGVLFVVVAVARGGMQDFPDGDHDHDRDQPQKQTAAHPRTGRAAGGAHRLEPPSAEGLYHGYGLTFTNKSVRSSVGGRPLVKSSTERSVASTSCWADEPLHSRKTSSSRAVPKRRASFPRASV